MLYLDKELFMEVDYLFQIGDKIVYPMQGAGVIKSIEEKEVSGIKQKYCIINMLNNNMQIMIPLEKLSNSGIRPIVDSDTLEKVLSDFNQKTLHIDDSLSYRERYQVNMDKIKTGKLEEASEVVHDLTLMNNTKTLNTNEKQLLTTARKILISEISLIKGISERQAEDLLDACPI